MNLILAWLLLFCFSGCASMFNGSTSTVQYDTSKSVQYNTHLSYRTEQTTSKEPTSILSIESSIPDADIYIDGEFAGKGVVSNKEVKYKETHTIVIEKVGFKPQSFTLHPDGTFATDTEVAPLNIHNG